jgi:hypothetical protein
VQERDLEVPAKAQNPESVEAFLENFEDRGNEPSSLVIACF